MWDDVGIVRDAEGLARAEAGLAALDAELDRAGVGGGRGFNLTWHDWLNLRSLVTVSRAIAASAASRGDCRGAHWRRDGVEDPDLAASRYTRVRFAGGAPVVDTAPVAFTLVRPGETLLRDAAA
jgi:fumarate reductase flavoprotein subunit